MQLSELYMLCGDTLTAAPDHMVRVSFAWGRHFAPQIPAKHACLQDAAIIAGLHITGYSLVLYPWGLGMQQTGRALSALGL